MAEKLKKLYHVLSIIFYICFFLAIWDGWMKVDGKSYGLIGYIMMVQKSGGIGSVANGDPGLTASFFFFFIPAVTGILSLFYAISKCIKYPARRIHQVIIWGEFIYSVAGIFLFSMVPELWTWLIPILCLIDYVVGQYFDQRDDILKADRERKEREKREQEERKRRLDFPGRYTSYFYRMIAKNVKYHLRNYVMLVISGTFFMMFLFLMFSLQYTFQGIHTEEMMIVGGGMQKILLDAIWIGLFLNAVMMGLSFSYYIKNKMKEEHALVLLGIRKKALTYMIIIEYIGCLTCSVLFGVVAGNIGLRIILTLLRRKIDVPYAGVPFLYYVLMVIIFVSAALVAAAVNSEVYNHVRWDAEGLLTKRYRIPGKKAWIYGIFGGLLIFEAVSNFTLRDSGEGVELLAEFLLGFFLALKCVKAAFIRRVRDKEECYYRYIFEQIPFLNQFQKNVNKLVLLCTVSFLMMYVFTSQFVGIAAAPEAETLYRYDFVCMASEGDKADFDNLKGIESLDIKKLPMIRVTVAQPDNGSLLGLLDGQYMNGILGQQVGISESSYRLLKGNSKGKSPGLTGEEIHVVYQEDTSTQAHPIDWYLPEEGVHLNAGEQTYTPRKVKSEERSVLTGVLEKGAEEHIVVFSDAYFDQVYKEAKQAEGEQTTLYLINCGKKDAAAVEKGLEEFAARYKTDPYGDDGYHAYYEKQQMIRDTETERYLQKIIWLFVLFMVGFCGVYLLFVKFCFEMDDITKRYSFLDCMGMHEKKWKKTLRKEMLPFWGVPFAAGGIFSVLFTVITFKVRLYSQAEIFHYMKYAAVIWLVYWILQAAAYGMIRKMLMTGIRNAGGKEQ